MLLDALDDIGGHARRNEFVSRSGRRLIGYGGSQSLDAPSLFSAASHHLLKAVGVDLIDRVGEDNVCFEVDYPHQDSTWPSSEEVARQTFGHLTPPQIHKIARGNAIRLLGLPEQAPAMAGGVRA